MHRGHVEYVHGAADGVLHRRLGLPLDVDVRVSGELRRRGSSPRRIHGRRWVHDGLHPAQLGPRSRGLRWRRRGPVSRAQRLDASTIVAWSIRQRSRSRGAVGIARRSRLVERGRRLSDWVGRHKRNLGPRHRRDSRGSSMAAPKAESSDPIGSAGGSRQRSPMLNVCPRRRSSGAARRYGFTVRSRSVFDLSLAFL
jgi:hypothetical protein